MPAVGREADLDTEKLVIRMNLRDLLRGEARISRTLPMAMCRRGVESRLVVEDDREELT